MKKLLFICLGNICRSPIAEATFQKIAAQKGLSEHFEVDSAGTMGWHEGQLPDKRTRANAEKHGIKLTHKGRKLTKEDLDVFDHLVVMDKTNFEDVYEFYYKTKGVTPSEQKLFLLRDYDPNRGTEEEVPDPYYEGEAFFEEVYQIVYRCNDALINVLNKQN